MIRMGILRKNFGESPQYDPGDLAGDGFAIILVDQFISHPVHDKAPDGLGIHLGFHVLPDGFYGSRAQENNFGNFFRRFVFCQQLEDLDLLFIERDRGIVSIMLANIFPLH
jgi:hypothetical protein